MMVPFRGSGAAADQTAPLRIIQVSHVTLRLKQEPDAGNAGMPTSRTPASNTQPGGGMSDWLIDEAAHEGGVQWPTQTTTTTSSTPGQQVANTNSAAGDVSTGSGSGGAVPGQAHLANVGLVVWQSGVLLAELLVRKPPYGPWGPHVHVLDLGTGTGLVGITLCLAGARVTLTDLPHILPLTNANVSSNCPPSAPIRVVGYTWGLDVAPLLQQVGGQQPDVITGADLLYDCTQHAALLTSLVALAAPHTIIYLSYRKRSKAEESWVPAAEAAGFAVEEVPDSHLHEEYQGGSYRVLRMAWREAAAHEMGAGAQTELRVAPHPCDVSDSEHEDLEHRPCAQS